MNKIRSKLFTEIEKKKVQGTIDQTLTAATLFDVARRIEKGHSLQNIEGIATLVSEASTLAERIQRETPLRKNRNKCPALLRLRNFYRDFSRNGTEWLAARDLSVDGSTAVPESTVASTQGGVSSEESQQAGEPYLPLHGPVDDDLTGDEAQEDDHSDGGVSLGKYE